MKKSAVCLIVAALILTLGPRVLFGQTGSVSGRVTNPLDAGIPNIRVEFFDSATGEPMSSVNTDGSGNYTKTGLNPGTYKILFYFPSPSGIPAVPEWYNDKPSFSTADIITVTPGGSLTGINAQLRFDPNEPNDNIAQAETLTPGTYTDRVQYAGGDADWHKVYVAQGKDLRFSTTNCRIFDPDPANDDMDISIRDTAGNLIGFAVSARSEETIYAANLTAGYYYVVVDYTVACLYDMIIGVGDLAIGEITGRVTNTLGQGVQNIPVKFYPEGDSAWDAQFYDAYTDAGGYFHFAFTPGNYKAQFQTPDVRNAVPSDLYAIGGWWYNYAGNFADAQVLTITANQTHSGIDTVYMDGAVITGHVTDNSGSPVAYQPVYAFDQMGNQIGVGWTDSNGDYTINAVFVEDGQCRVRFQYNPANQAQEWYNDKASFGAADPVSIQPRQTTSGINAQLVNQGRIQGQVTNGSTPIAGIQVQAYDTIQTLRLLGTATTDGSGNYTIRLLPTANVRLLFHSNGTSYAGEWNNDKASFDTADAIAVTAGSTVNGINAVLVQGGSVSGTVTDERTGLPLNGIRAELWTAANQFYQAVTTDASGIYTFTGAAAGSYRLFFNRFSRFYGSEWYNNKAGFAAGDTITVLTGQALSGRDAALTPVSRVQGRVTNLSAAGIQSVTVEVRDANNQTVGSDTTDSMGYYYVYGIPKGTYWVYFDGTAAGYAGEYYSDKLTFAAGDTIAVTPGVFGPVANAQLAAGGGITGRVTGPGGAGVQNIKVQIKDIYGNNVAQPTTDINGDYSSGGMAAGTYRIFFSNNGLDYVSEWYSDRYSLQTASDVTVLAGSVTSNVNAQLVSSGTISGTVTDGSAGVSGVKVVLFDIYLNNTGFSATTDASGNYTIKAIPAGTYKIAFNSPTGGAAPSLIREWYNDKPTPQAADTVTVTAGGTLSGTNAVLAPGGNISGRVTSQATGLGIGEIGVNAYDATGVQVSGAATDASGNFMVKSLATGSYRLEFNPATYNSTYGGTYLREYFNNKAGLAAADAVAVTAGQTLSGVNAILASGGATISGRVTNAAGMGLRDVTVRVELEGYELSNQYSASTAVDGAYTVRGIPAGTYSVLFTPSGTSGNYARELYNDVVPKGWVWTGTPVVLTDGAVVSGIDAVLEAGGWVKGRVTDGAGAGIANVQVRTHDALTNDRVDAGPKTDAAGHYAASARPGQHKIFFSASESAGGQYAAEFYNNKTTLPAADAVTVTADQTTPNIDAVLAAGTAGGTIAGTVRDYQGNPVAGAGIQVFTLDGSNAMLVNVSTDPSGAFSLAGFIPGNYKLLTHVFWLGLEEWYSDKTAYAAADTITVSAGQTTTTDVYLGDSGTLTLTAPNGGEVLNVGQSFAITWTSSGTLGNVKLDYSTNSGANWTAIIASTENDGSYSWIVPSAPSINCLVRVSETDGNPTDQSNAAFTIGTVVSPTITIVSPNGGESLTVGAAHNITWSSTGVVGNVKIEYSIDGGSHYSEVVASTANDGSFSWTVPGTPATTCLVRLSETDGSPWDVSNAVFTIAVVTPPPVNGLAIDFGAAGFWIWENYIWTQVSGVNPESLAAADMDGDGADELVIDFGTVGAWLLDGTSWTQLSGVNADGFIGADIDADGADELVGDFGSTGLWLWNLTWTQLSGVNADGMIAADTDGDGVEEVVGDFGSTGLWLWKGGSWTQMSGVNADGVIAANVDPAAGREIIADFGTTGLWLLKTGAWSQISGVNAQGLAAGRVDADAEEEVAADFGGLGVWVYDAGAWSLVSGANPDQLVVANMTVDADDEIVADFATIGIYLWDSGAWVQINGVNPDFLIAANVDLDLEAEIAADFATLGVWLWNNGVWNQISNTNPENMIAKY